TSGRNLQTTSDHQYPLGFYSVNCVCRRMRPVRLWSVPKIKRIACNGLALCYTPALVAGIPTRLDFVTGGDSVALRKTPWPSRQPARGHKGKGGVPVSGSH